MKWANRIIHTENVSKQFGDHLAVNGLNLQVEKQAVYGFLGPNGAGKTTTIRMLLGLIRPTSGNIYLFGKPLSRYRSSLLSRIGSLVESPSYYGNLTAYENLEVVRIMFSAPKSEIERVLQIVGLTKDAHRLVKGYSLGMRQRLGIAMALLNRPDLLLLDEPTNGLDPAGIHEIRELIMRLPDEYGLTALISSHNLYEIELISTHVGIINKGNMIFQGTIQELKEKSTSNLHIQTNDPPAAKKVLQKKGYKVQDHEDMLIIDAQQCDAAAINRQLVGQGIDVRQLYFKKPTLEEIFLNLTREGEQK